MYKRQVQDHSLNVLVKISTDEGLWGIGEAAPFEPVTGESAATVLAVSYTHLDVYKRQTRSSAANSSITVRTASPFCCCATSAISPPTPVSYTHLGDLFDDSDRT